MEILSHIAGGLGLVLGIINLFKKKDYPSRAEFKEMNNTVQEHKQILRNSRK